MEEEDAAADEAAGLLLATAEEAEQQQEAADLLLAAAEEAADLLLATAEEVVEDETMLQDCHDAELAQKLAQTLIGALFCCHYSMCCRSCDTSSARGSDFLDSCNLPCYSYNHSRALYENYRVRPLFVQLVCGSAVRGTVGTCAIPSRSYEVER